MIDWPALVMICAWPSRMATVVLPVLSTAMR
jgi:hypothetical protein